MPPQIRVLTDSVADVPRHLLTRYRIGVVPVYLVLNGHTYSDDGTLDQDWFYRELARIEARPSTAAPSPEEYLVAYGALAEAGAEEIIVLSASATVSSLYDHAVTAAHQFDRARVHVVDTQQVSMGMGWMVLEAARRVDEGASVAQVLDYLEAMRSRISVYGVLDSIDYLRRSGRVGWVASFVAGFLQIRPLIGFEQGEAQLRGRVRLYRRGIQALRQLIEAAQPLTHMAILHSGVDANMIEMFQTEVGRLLPSLEIPVVDVGSIFATHVGPRCLGVALVRAQQGSDQGGATELDA
jgi:DegV family protein with EDD domain